MFPPKTINLGFITNVSFIWVKLACFTYNCILWGKPDTLATLPTPLDFLFYYENCYYLLQFNCREKLRSCQLRTNGIRVLRIWSLLIVTLTCVKNTFSRLSSETVKFHIRGLTWSLDSKLNFSISRTFTLRS